MKERRYFYVPDAANQTELPVEEASHATRVLRLQSGDEMFLMDGEGTFYRAEVTLATPKKCLYDIKETMPQEKGWHGRIHLAIAPTKMIDRMEWMVEKATEVGFDEVTFLNCRFSERKVLRIDRLEKIVVAAMKQSRKPWIPVVNPLVSFAEFVKTPREGRKYIAHCYEEIQRKDLFDELLSATKPEDITVLVGPEGDFSIDEVELAMKHGFESISLGNSRLRTETAGLSAVMMAQMTMRK
ncbi:MAG: 16S rRNA (uracil(1498)-N(3))-methyltransferase [Prevotella sp.]|nr:16S rRNA (uracil(1498)-N(3))-methyltransferase [Prevotella sp.]